MTFQLHHTALTGDTPGTSTNLYWYTAGPADVCTVSGTTITLVGPGACEVTADQAGDDTHAPATVSASFAVTLITQSITVPTIAPTPLSDGTVDLPATTDPGGLPLTYTAGPSTVCTVTGTTLTLVGPGTWDAL